MAGQPNIRINKPLKLGSSFSQQPSSAFHTIRYDFQPLSADTSQEAAVEIGPGNQVSVSVPNLEGSDTSHTFYRGHKRHLPKECVLILNKKTGEVTLERLSCIVQVKKTRLEAGSGRVDKAETGASRVASQQLSTSRPSTPTGAVVGGSAAKKRVESAENGSSRPLAPPLAPPRANPVAPATTNNHKLYQDLALSDSSSDSDSD